MAFASAVMMLAESPQIFLSLASTQDSFLPIVDVLTVYGRHASSEVRQMLAHFSLTPSRDRRTGWLSLRHQIADKSGLSI